MTKHSDPLKAYRDEKDLSQQQLADKLGVSRAMVSMLEVGGRPYTADMCLLIEKRLRIPRERMRPDLFEKAA